MEKSNPLRFLPNLITLANLFFGCVGVVLALNSEIRLAVYLIWVCGVLDVLDGLAARGLGVSSDIGKQLDSLADLVSFGLLPSVIIYSLMAGYLEIPWPYFALLIPLFSALRLARYNLDPEQNIDFKGLPAPANAIFISSFPAIIDQIGGNLRPELENPVYWLLMIAILCYLLVSKVWLFGLKFQSLGWTQNKYRYLFIVLSAILVIAWGVKAVPLVMLYYLVLSFIWQYQSSR
jgi:CDP-diacylglycerol--serine O-phosphatidyltransferase